MKQAFFEMYHGAIKGHDVPFVLRIKASVFIHTFPYGDVPIPARVDYIDGEIVMDWGGDKKCWFDSVEDNLIIGEGEEHEQLSRHINNYCIIISSAINGIHIDA